MIEQRESRVRCIVMKNKFNLRKLIFIFIGMFFCVIPIEAKAADYEANFKFYKFNNAMPSTVPWFTQYKSGIE